MNLAPYEWPARSGCLTADVLAHYSAWLLPMCEVEFQSNGQEDRGISRKNGKQAALWEPVKKEGWLNVNRHLRPFVVHVISRLKPYSHRAPYLPRKRKGMAQVADLQDFHSWVLKTLEHKKNSQQRTKKSPIQ